jgi:hypothetical protein
LPSGILPLFDHFDDNWHFAIVWPFWSWHFDGFRGLGFLLIAVSISFVAMLSCHFLHGFPPIGHGSRSLAPVVGFVCCWCE